MDPIERYKQYEVMTAKAEVMVKKRITGHRKGMEDQPSYLHSFRVRDLVMKSHHMDDLDYDLFLAALLHDVIEDGGVTFDELLAMGFSQRTIDLVGLCTHNMVIENKTERWTLMIAKLIEARDEDAWRIKLADLTDNLTQCAGLSLENRRFMVEVKAPLMIRLTEKLTMSKAVNKDYVALIYVLEEEMNRQRELMG